MKRWRDHDGVVIHSTISILYAEPKGNRVEYSIRCRPGRVFGDRYTEEPVNCIACLVLRSEGRWE